MKYLSCILFVFLLSSCALVTPVTNETTGPTITFNSARNSNIPYLSVSSSEFVANPTVLTAVANDNGGVQSLSLSFSNVTADCAIGGTTYEGSFLFSPVPAQQSTTSTPDSSGKVSPSLAIISNLQGPYTCTVPGVGNENSGKPAFNAPFTATAIASNYSGKSTTATLQIYLIP